MSGELRYLNLFIFFIVTLFANTGGNLLEKLSPTYDRQAFRSLDHTYASQEKQNTLDSSPVSQRLFSLVSWPQKFIDSIAPRSVPHTVEDDLRNHPSWQLLLHKEVQCGESFADRIIGGKDAALGQYPWLARLGYESEELPKEVQYKCGGSLINTIYVITAGHCVTPQSPVAVRLGEHDIRTEIDCSNDVCAEKPQDFIPEKVVLHDFYDMPKFSHDLALVRLNKEAIYNGWVGHICLPRPGFFHLDPKNKAETAGWGIVSMDTLETAEVLQTLTVPLVNLTQCQLFYRRVMTLTHEQTCAGGKVDRDACGGDSGGPLMQVDMGDEFPQYFLIGVVSFGPSMCGGEAPGVFANTSYHLKWILDNIERFEPAEKQT